MEDRKGKYGLILPSKLKKVPVQILPNAVKRKAPTTNVFGDDSDSEENEGGGDDWVQRTLKQSVQGSVQQKQATQVIKKALKEDPTVYQYDELYDEMETRREQSKEESVKEKKPKYIDKLLKAAEKRQQDFEARLERDVQKEREAEGDMYKDKESFVTGAYRKKMEEMEQLKEEQRRKDAIDDMVDVTKQKDLSGFYRHLYKQTMDAGHNNSLEKPRKETDVSKPSGEYVTPHTPRKFLQKQSVLESVQDQQMQATQVIKKALKEDPTVYQYDELYEARLERDVQKEREAEGDMYNDKESFATGAYRKKMEEMELKEEQRRKDTIDDVVDVAKQKDLSGFNRNLYKQTMDADHNKSLEKSREETDVSNTSGENVTPHIPRKPVWEKRTIGQVFSDAVERYLERKSSNALQACVVLAK